MSAHAGQRGPGLWDEVCSPKMQRWTLLALADLFVINRPHTQPPSMMRRREGCGAAILCAGVLAVLTGYVWCSTARRGPCDDAGEGVPVRART